MKDDIDKIRQGYAQTLEELLTDPKSQIKVEPTLDLTNCVKLISDIFARVETHSLCYDTSRYGMLEEIGKITTNEALWHNRSMICMNLIDAITVKDGAAFNEHVKNLQALCIISIAKAKKAVAEKGVNELEIVTRYMREISDIEKNTLTYIKIIRTMDERLKLEIRKNEEREINADVEWIARRYTSDHVLRSRLNLYKGAYDKLRYGLRNKDEDQVIDAILSINNSNVAIRMESVPSGSGLLKSAMCVVKEEMPDRYNFLRYCVRLMIKQKRAQRQAQQ
jgi:hypothetical protein